MNDIFFMKQALEQAHLSEKQKEVPVGAVLVDQNKNIVAYGWNRREREKDIFSHAEINAIKMYCENEDTWRLNKLTMYVTLEPCLMCIGAMYEGKLKKLVYGASRQQDSVVDFVQDIKLNHKMEITKGVLKEQCESILQNFFKKLRN